jgi:hypothetical protein
MALLVLSRRSNHCSNKQNIYCKLGLDRYRYRVSGDTHQYRLVSVSGDSFLSVAAYRYR